MLGKRFITALWGLPLLIAAIWFDGPLPWFTIFAAIWGLLAVLEFYRMAAVSKVLPLTCFGAVCTLLFIVNPHFGFPAPLLLTSAIVLSLIMLVLSPQREGAFQNWVWMIAGILYIGWLISYPVLLRLEAGRGWVFLTLFATFGSDTTAFFVGSALGRHRLAPRISPKKTWEGAFGGVFGAVIASLIIVSVFDLPLGFGQTVFLGILVSVFGQFGDLVESLLKRHTGVKDSGNLLPGHGGLLDRTDSILFAGVAVYFYYILAVL